MFDYIYSQMEKTVMKWLKYTAPGERFILILSLFITVVGVISGIVASYWGYWGGLWALLLVPLCWMTWNAIKGAADYRKYYNTPKHRW